MSRRAAVTPGACDCGTDPSSGFHAVWCEVYSKHARERYGNRDDRETIALDLAVRTLAEFQKSPVCKRCRAGIPTVEQALLVELGSDETYLIHATLDCYESEVEALLDRYLPAESQAVVNQSTTEAAA